MNYRQFIAGRSLTRGDKTLVLDRTFSAIIWSSLGDVLMILVTSSVSNLKSLNMFYVIVSFMENYVLNFHRYTNQIIRLYS